MKVVLFGSQLIQLGTMKKEDIATHSDLVVFYTIFYIRQWTQSPLLVDSAINDLTLLKELKKMNHQPFERFKKAMSEKLECHLWFLSEELVFTCLFSDLLTDSQKNKCAQALRSHKPSEQLGKLVTPQLVARQEFRTCLGQGPTYSHVCLKFLRTSLNYQQPHGAVMSPITN